MTISSSAKTVLAALMLALTVMLIMPACAFADDTEELPEADRFGQVKLYSTVTPGKVLKDSYHFTDDWFSDVDPKTENKDLALLSMQFVAAAVDNDHDGLGGDFLRELGFRKIGYYGSPDPVEADCNYTYGEISLDDNTTLIAVAIQSYAFDKDGKAKGWPQNFEVNGDSEEGEHYMLSKVADNMLEKLEKLSDDREVRYWITGQSRGGALANLIAAKLPACLGTRNLGIFAYTFEAPNVVQPENDADRERIRNDYGYIHNYVCSDDPVTMIPPWGMVRYGVDHELDTIETNEGLEKELEKLGSDAKLPEGYNKEDAHNKAQDVINVLEEEKIPSRLYYSEEHSDTITLDDGSQKVIGYKYQDILGKLMATVFGGALDEADLSQLVENLTEAMGRLEPFVRGYLAECKMLDGDPDPNEYYWKAATEINPFLKEKVNLDLKLTDEELYTLLKLIAPVVIDQYAGGSIGYDPNSDEDMPVLSYIAPALDLTDMIFSHHFDPLIARLHTLAPAPQVSELALELYDTDTPEATDPTTRMPRKIDQAVSISPYYTWLDASAEWETKDTTLKNNKVYYLKVVFSAPGHSVTDDVKVTINGEQPVSTEVSWKDGQALITAVWKYTFGTPKMFEVGFDLEDHGVNPDPMSVEAGTMLKYMEKPADPVYDGYRFDGWYDEDGTPWDDMTIVHDMKIDEDGDGGMKAKWIRQISKVKVNFTVPRVGQKWKYPTVSAGSGYRVEVPDVWDADYNSVTTIKKKQTMTLTFRVYVNSKDAEFPEIIDEDDLSQYGGTVTINGKPATEIGLEEEALRIQFKFKPLDRLPKLSKKSITVKKGKTAKVKILYKKKGSKNTYKKTKYAKVISKRNASTIKVKGLKKGKTTLKIKVNGTWLKLKVRVK